MAYTLYPIRNIARITIEADSPLSISSGEKSTLTDAPVLRDVHRLPFIPGTSLAGVIRHALPYEELQQTLMGWQSPTGGEGSRLIISEAKILDSRGRAVDGIAPIEEDPLLEAYSTLPIRQHTRIGHRGATEIRGKFDEEVVLRGTRFCFDMELISSAEEADSSDEALLRIINTIDSDLFRIGGGSRKGFGKVRVVRALHRRLDLRQPEELSLYLAKSSCLSAEWEGFAPYTPREIEERESDRYLLTLRPVDFIFFGSGHEDNEGNNQYVTEQQIVWEGDRATIIDAEQMILIPSSSVKGALSHRTAFHYNKQQGVAADNLPEGAVIEDYIGQKNGAVALLFGTVGKESGEGCSRGHVLFSDVLLKRPEAAEDHVFNHVRIDRFTGGAVSGALFSEKSVYAAEEEITMEITIDKHALESEDRDRVHDALSALESAMKDLCGGMLPLGGSVTKGNGRFYGSITKNGETIYEYDRA